jgi:hypothetical protein
MKVLILTALLLVATGLAFADPNESIDIGVTEVKTLGSLNGTALACRQYAASNEAKAMMIRYAPKTRRYGALFETATNAAFVAAAKDGAPCPTEADLFGLLAESETALQAVFPESAQPEQSAPVPPSDETGS